MQCGDTFLLYDEESGSKPHLHIVITDPDVRGLCVLVSVTTRRAKSDTMVCLEVGDHPFLTHASVITYAYSKVLSMSRIAKLCASGEAVVRERASVALVARAQRGMLETDRAPREVQALFRSMHSS